MSKITITCPRCGVDFATDAESGTAVCPECECRLLLKRRDARETALDPDASATGSGDALENNDEIRESRVVSSVMRDDPTLETIDEALKKGDFFLERNQFNQALYVFKNAAASKPDDYRAWWGVATATLQHLAAYLDGLQLLTSVSPVQSVYDRQMLSAEKAMEQVRLLAPDKYVDMLSERYSEERGIAETSLKRALKTCKKNIAKRTKKPAKTLLYAMAALIAVCGSALAILLPIDLVWKLATGAVTLVAAGLSFVLAMRS